MSVALITGASSGIGAALATELHARGWTVGLIARRREALDALASTLGERVAVAQADVADRAAVEAAIRTLETALGPCDLLVANAGAGGLTPATRLDLDIAVGVLRTNVEGVLYTVNAVLPGMLARGRGQIAAVSSVAGYRGIPPTGMYSASKAAVTALMEAFRIELGPRGIAVTTIHPGFVKSEMSDKNRFYMPLLMPAERAARILADRLPGRPSEINFPWPVAAVMWLARILPNFLFDPILRRLSPGPRPRDTRNAPPGVSP